MTPRWHRAEDLTIAVRDYLNEGGTLVHTGETAGYFGTLGPDLGGIWYGVDGAPGARCGEGPDPYNCLLLSDDFFQYYLGAYARVPRDAPLSFTGQGPLSGTGGRFGGPAVAANPLDEAGTFVPTSDVLPRDRFPLFASRAAGSYAGASPGPFDPVQGSWYAGTVHHDDAYLRLARTYDLRSVPAGQRPTFATQLSYDTEPGYDNVVVEAHVVGDDRWTTLPEAGGLTTTTPPTECEVGYLLAEHPFLEHYLTPGDDACTSTGTTGAWNALTGSSDGWKDVRFDLSAYAGQQVEVVVSYVTDPGGGGQGVAIDDTRLLVDGRATQEEGFESGLGSWSTPGPPAGSPVGDERFRRTQGLYAAAVTTRQTVLLGFGLEQLADPADRARVLQDALRRVRR